MKKSILAVCLVVCLGIVGCRREENVGPEPEIISEEVIEEETESQEETMEVKEKIVAGMLLEKPYKVGDEVYRIEDPGYLDYISDFTIGDKEKAEEGTRIPITYHLNNGIADAIIHAYYVDDGADGYFLFNRTEFLDLDLIGKWECTWTDISGIASVYTISEFDKYTGEFHGTITYPNSGIDWSEERDGFIDMRNGMFCQDTIEDIWGPYEGRSMDTGIFNPVHMKFMCHQINMGKDEVEAYGTLTKIE